jgi:hypothetical protein
MSKVYCGECVYFREGGRPDHGPFMPERCDAPENLKDTHTHARTARWMTPEQRNSANNCPYFKAIEKPKWWQFWR